MNLNQLLCELLGLPARTRKATLRMEALKPPVVEVEIYLDDLDAPMGATETRAFQLVPIGQPDGYAVLQTDGAFVGAWRDRASAELVLNRSQAAKGERLVEIFVREPLTADRSHNDADPA